MTTQKKPVNRFVSIDQDVYDALKKSAEANMRTIKGQTHWIIRDFFNRKDLKI